MSGILGACIFAGPRVGVGASIESVIVACGWGPSVVPRQMWVARSMGLHTRLPAMMTADARGGILLPT